MTTSIKEKTPGTSGLAGRVAIVTGGAQGIGRTVAEKLIADGALVTLWDRDGKLVKKTATEIGASFDIVDQTDWSDVQRAAETTFAQASRIDILVNNAGIAGVNAPTWDYPIEAWKQVIDVNLTGVFHCCKAVVPRMIASRYGRIVNVASIAGKEGNPNAVAYSASKAGVIALTKSLGKETAKYDIAVNCITPAAAKTAIFDQMSQAHIDFMLSKIPRGRFLQVNEVASMVAWLVSAENSFATGAVFDISGGRATY